MSRGTVFSLIAVLAALLSGSSGRAQGTTGPKIRDSNVGYIDPAIPGTFVRFQVDSAFNNVSPTRSEFFWSPGPPDGRGPSIPERSVDYVDQTTHFEYCLLPTTSVFAAVPIRFLNPELNSNTTGLADINLGIKQAIVLQEDFVATLQLRTYVPSGDSDRGIGTGHVSLEPAILLYKPLSAGWTAEAELRDWVPVGGGDFTGNVIRYGLGVHYDDLQVGSFKFVPIAEFVGWTSLGGKVVMPTDAGPFNVRSATGDTIVNVKTGVRWKFSESADLFAGYGKPLTDQSWYDEVVRIELRLLF